MALTKVVQSPLFPIASVAAGVVVASAAFQCLTDFTSDFYIDWAPAAATAAPAATEWRIECSELDSDVLWTPIYSRLTFDIQANNPNVSVATAGANAITVSNGTGFGNGQWAFFLNGTIGQSEWHFVTDLSGTTFHTLDNLAFGQTGSANVFNYALKEHVELPLNAKVRYRFVVNNNRSGTPRTMVFRCNHTVLTAVS